LTADRLELGASSWATGYYVKRPVSNGTYAVIAANLTALVYTKSAWQRDGLLTMSSGHELVCESGNSAEVSGCVVSKVSHQSALQRAPVYT